MVHKDFIAKVVDVETAFLYGDLEEEIYMECPKGLEGVTHEDALALNQSIYGLVQASRQYHKKMVVILRQIGFVGGNVDPYLLMRMYKCGTVYVVLYVDDNLVVGHSAAVMDTIWKIEWNGLTLKVEDNLKDYLSCEIQMDNARKNGWLG